jgi:all-trans-retinol dehydrogenase (NAD+)
MQFKDNSVLITGGASGIGKIMARLLLEHGAKVIIWDIDESKTTAVISELSALGVIVGYTVDISSNKRLAGLIFLSIMQV